MSVRTNKLPPALKHGIYASTALLPGEDSVAFQKLREKITAELQPIGPLEIDAVESIARLTWRKQNLGTFQRAKLAHDRYSIIQSEHLPHSAFDLPFGPDAAEIKAAHQAAEDQARKELGPSFELIEVGDLITAARLLEDLDLEQRLDAAIDKSLKRLLFLRGLKSLATA